MGLPPKYHRRGILAVQRYYEAQNALLNGATVRPQSRQEVCMNQSKEFQGKSLDEAIQEACDFYGVPREKLTIDIVSDAKSGIFGLVGVKKAIIRVSRVPLSGTAPLQAGEGGQRASGKERQPRQERGCPVEEQAAARHDAKPCPKPERAAGASEDGKADGPGGKARGTKNSRGGAPLAAPRAKPAAVSAASADEAASAPRLEEASPGRMRGPLKTAATGRGQGHAAPAPVLPHSEAEEGRDDLPEFSLDGCDREALSRVVRETVLTLVAPIVGPVPCSVEIAGNRVRAVLDCGEAAGILVGRDGLTLAAVQYLAARIVSRKMGGAVRLQIDAGKYRERQDDKLRELALSLAAKVRETGRPQSTRPLSAYQRRIVHLALERDAAVTTRSKGEGPQRRVVVYASRGTAEEQKGGNSGTDLLQDIPDSPDE